MSEKNLYENEDHTWTIRMKMLTRRKKNLQIAQTIDDALYEYYVIERGQEVPNWRYVKDQDWWQEYLIRLGLNPNNP
jgi:hypothetical protein